MTVTRTIDSGRTRNRLVASGHSTLNLATMYSLQRGLFMHSFLHLIWRRSRLYLVMAVGKLYEISTPCLDLKGRR